MRVLTTSTAKQLLIIGAALSAIGCTSGPILMGQDTYMMTGTGAWSWTSGAEVKGDLFQSAIQFCHNQKKEFMPLNSRQNDANMVGSWAHAELQFRCLQQGDPELGRPNMQPVPNVIIQAK